MPGKAHDNAVSQALLKFLTDGSFPETEDLVSAEFPPTAAAKQLSQISKAREEVKNEICALSQESASDVDGWISQAKQLHEDIERSRSTAREIVRQHEKGQQLQSEVTDAASKVELLQTEIEFNEAVTRNLEDIRTIDRRITSVQSAIEQDDLETALGLFEEIEMLLKTTGLPSTTPVLRILSQSAVELRNTLTTVLRQKWNSMVTVDPSLGQITIPIDNPDSPASVGKVLAALGRLDLLGSIVDSLYKAIYSGILSPVLLSTGAETRTLSHDGDSVRVLPQSSSTGPADIFDILLSFLKYLQERLPPAVSEPLTAKLVPPMVSTLVSKKLSPSIPSGLDGMTEFQGILDRAHKFGQDLGAIGCPGSDDIRLFAQQISHLWPNQRRDKSLHEVRAILSASAGQTKKVERAETQQVSQKDNIFAENSHDDWDAGWASDNEQPTDATAPKETSNDDDDFSAWDEPETAEEPTEEPSKAKPNDDEDDDGTDAWGWGDDDEEENTAPAPEPAAHLNGNGDGKSSPRRQVTLRESYTITDVPDAIIGIIVNLVSDAEKLLSPEYSNLQVASSGPALLKIPTLVIVMFKAVAPMFYSQKFNSGQMYLYNDSIYFAEQLRHLIEERNLPTLKPEIDAIEVFGKIAYGKEMESQRTILSDLLDGSQGFTTCSEQPYLGQCEKAVSATVERVQDVYKEWSSILSQSALLQSIGSLLSTVINRMIINIEDLSDISDAESQRLAGFCNQISKLENLFLPKLQPGQDAGGQETLAMASMYVPSWFKFQYLTNILESSLADIKYLWTEGELKLEFSPTEVTDLITALFADSEHRRRALNEIRRTSRTS
ncbi:hypothetical protein FQN50_001477 [Emmonsiellopsis sp. PD_5]|nr:hypothetical protein FQN50_001477 [Emmonsiellopsis sp. PD_5]